MSLKHIIMFAARRSRSLRSRRRPLHRASRFMTPRSYLQIH